MLIQFLLVVAFGLAAASVWRRERSGQLSRFAAVLWSVIWIAAGVVVALPETASWFAVRLGVGRGSDAVIYVAVALLYYLMFRLFIGQRKLEADISRLVKELALRELEDRVDAGEETKR